MALTKLTNDLNVVQGLPDSPNAGVGGLTSTQLKVKFDTAGNAIKDYLNNTLTTETDAQLALKAPLASPTFTGTPTVTQLQFNTAGGTSGIGELAWNTTDGTLEFGLTGGNVTLQVGQEEVLRVLNNTGSSIGNGSVVYITGASGQRPTIALAQGNSEATSSKTIGIATESIANNQQGFITLTGLVRDLDTSAFTEGVSLWLSPTVAGGITSTKPVAPNHSVLIGFCIRSHATQGIILAKVQNGNELDELHDVLIGTKANKDLLAYDSAAGVWKNQTFTTLDLPTKTYVDSQDALKANIASPTFTGTVGLPLTTTLASNPAADNNTTQVATTAFVLGQASITTPNTVGSTAGAIGTSTRFAKADHTHQLATSGVTAGTYTKIAVDVYGRATSGTSLSAADIPALDFSKITTGTVPIAQGGTGATTAGTALTNLGAAPIASPNHTGNAYFNTSTASTAPSSSVTGSAFITASNGRSQLLMSSSATTTMNLVSFFNPNGNVGNISTSGTTTTYGTTSDYRLKQDFQDFKGQELLNKVKVYDYAWKADETRSYGVIAHELQEVLPYAVIGEKDAVDEEGNIAPQNVDYSKLVPILIKTIQEQNERILALEAKVGV